MYRLTYDGRSEEHDRRTQAVRALAGAVRAQPLTDSERQAFNRWYTHRNYRSAALALYHGHRYELHVSVSGRRRTFAIDPPPPSSPTPNREP